MFNPPKKVHFTSISLWISDLSIHKAGTVLTCLHLHKVANSVHTLPIYTRGIVDLHLQWQSLKVAKLMECFGMFVF